jgi:quinoprotein glucose dehydrogenase
MSLRRSLPFLFALLPALVLAQNDPGSADAGAEDRADGASVVKDSAEAAVKKFSVAPGLRVDVWAAEPLLANPVAFAFDERGRAFVAETYRRRTSVPDIRKYEGWQLENLGLRSVEDRLKFITGKFPPGAKTRPTGALVDFNGDGTFDVRDWGVEMERVKLLTDTKGAGRADKATVFATVKSTPVTGLGAGVAVRGGVVYHTCAPDLWRYDGEKDGAAVQEQSLLHGFGVHVAFGGHDMHGVKFGPDGKIYWTIADCGSRVTTKEGTILDCPDSGAVYRCDPDGSNAELVAIGLRNPQSLAFNALGDLFTGDNNADGGDKARWTHIVDGADYGWRIGWQFLKTPNLLGPWNSEGLWHLDVDKTHAAILPPVGLIGHGPAGIAYYPGTGLPDQYRDHFFYADFPGGVRTFQLTPRGASYTVENPGNILQDNAQRNMTGKLLWGLYPSDVQFGVEGGAYVLDWIQGWEKTGKGRIYRVHDPLVDASAIVQETKKLLADGMEKRTPVELLKLLGHADQRVRLAAQAAAVARNDLDTLSRAAGGDGPLVWRLHGVWGLGQLAAKSMPAKQALVALLATGDAEVRAQAAKALGRAGLPGVVPALTKLLRDPAPRVRFFAAQSLSKLPAKDAVPDLFRLLQENADQDSFIRHAAVVALAAQADATTLLARAGDASEAVRLGVILALRRQASPEIARFLADKRPALVAETVRAIHDGPILGALPQVAALGSQTGFDEPTMRRIANANFLVGNANAAQRLARVAAERKSPATVRLEAIQSLALWNEPFQRNRITGLWHRLPAGRDPQAAVAAASPILSALFEDPEEKIRLAAAELAGSLKATSAEPALSAILADAKAAGKLRAAALRALDAIGTPKLPAAVQQALASGDRALAEAARKLSGKASPQLAVEVNAAVLGKGSIREQQEALATIGAQPVPEADRVLATQFAALEAGTLPRGLWLDLLEAVQQRDAPEWKARLAARAARATSDPMAKWSECLEGGDASLGRAIFTEKAEAACFRCHKVKGEGGDVGPDLTGLGQRKDRAYILESIVDPNASVAAGFENVVLTLRDGSMVAGLLSAEDAKELTIASVADGKRQKVSKDAVKERMAVPSAMPPGLSEVLGRRSLRDVVEFLSTVK